jgi:hypothetical protein
MKTKTDTRWFIVGVHGLYIGQWLTRKSAIEGHCLDYIWGHETTPATPFELETEWKRCRADGDRAVKVKITYPVI